MRKMGIGLGVGINRSNYAQGIFNAYSARVVADGGVVESGSCVDAVSSLLQSASLLLIPSGYKGGKLYAEIPTNGNGDLTWTRGSDAFRTNASGVIQRVPWNLFSWSEAFTNSAWSKSNATITADTITAPNGTLTADTIAFTTAGFVVQSFTHNGLMTFSLYAKYIATRWLCVENFNSVDKAAWFDLQNGVVGSTINGATSTITNVGDGWYRCVVTMTAVSSSASQYAFFTVSADSSFTRSGSAYFWGAQLVEGTTAQTYLPTTDRLNFPRLSYMYGSCPSALLEPQRTNLVLNSNDMTLWTNNPSTMTKNVATSPDGTNNALSYSNASVCSTIVTASNGVYSFSLYVKQGTSASASIDMSDSSTGDVVTTFTFSSKSFSGTSAGGSWTSAVTSYVELTNGWFRITLTATKNAGPGIVHKIMPSGTGTTLVYGAQLEAGAYPTTYIPTTSGATATRVADSFSRSNIYTNGLISASGGTWFVELRGNLAYTRDGSGFLGIGDTSALTTNSLVIFCPSTSSRLQIAKFIATVGTTLYTTTTDTVKIAVKWNGTSADVFANGTKVVSATLFTTTNMEFLQSSIQVPTFIQQMALYSTPLTDAQCQTLTT